MVDPVVSSRFGTRPLLEVPALQVSNHGAIEVPSLQVPYATYVSKNPFPSARNPMVGSGTYYPQTVYYTADGVPPGPAVYLNRKYPSAPQGPFYNPQGHAYYIGPNGEMVFPAPFYSPDSLYPGVVNPVPGCITIPQPAVVRVPYPTYGSTIPGFNITCELEYGRVMSIDVRDSEGEFRGIPEFLRNELLKSYGAYPYTEAKVKLEGGEFHIYATHENRRRHRRRRYRDYDSDSEYYEDDYYRYGSYPEWKSDVDSYSSGVRPRNPWDRPRGIVRERGWNRFR